MPDNVIDRIKKRIEGHDFCAEILDDEWCDHVSPRLTEYIKPAEWDALADDEAKQEAVDVIRRAFVTWLYEWHVGPLNTEQP